MFLLMTHTCRDPGFVHLITYITQYFTASLFYTFEKHLIFFQKYKFTEQKHNNKNSEIIMNINLAFLQFFAHCTFLKQDPSCKLNLQLPTINIQTASW